MAIWPISQLWPLCNLAAYNLYSLFLALYLKENLKKAGRDGGASIEGLRIMASQLM